MKIIKRIIFILILVYLTYIFYITYTSKYNINYIHQWQLDSFKGDENKLNIGLSNFEDKLSSWYPLGDDFFRISHGKKYLDFFRRLGVIQLILISDDKLIGTFTRIERNIKNKIYYYLCDLKVLPEYENEGLGTLMSIRNLWLKGIFSNWYSISMNSSNNNDGKVVSKLKKNKWLMPYIGIKYETLLIYSLDYNNINKILKLLEEEKGKIGFLSLEGKKDLILKSSNQSIKLLHLQWGETGDYNNKKTINGYEYMFCLLQKDKLVKNLEILGITTNISATLIHNCKNENFNFILTSDL